MPDETLEEWKAHLTSALREHFERVGEDLVRSDLSRQAYSDQSKRFAALAWLNEKRLARKNTETRRFWFMFFVTAIAAVAAAVAAWLSWD